MPSNLKPNASPWESLERRAGSLGCPPNWSSWIFSTDHSQTHLHLHCVVFWGFFFIRLHFSSVPETKIHTMDVFWRCPRAQGLDQAAVLPLWMGCIYVPRHPELQIKFLLKKKTLNHKHKNCIKQGQEQKRGGCWELHFKTTELPSIHCTDFFLNAHM